MPTERLYLSPVNLNKNELRQAVIQVLASAPSSPSAGQIYFDSALNRLQFYTGSAWIDATARANHSGTQPASTISDFDTQVRTSRLDQMAAPTAPVSFNSQRITNVADPTSTQDAATKNYVDNTAQGLSAKTAVAAATAAALPANAYSNGTNGVGATLTGNVNGALPSIDGYSAAVNDRILVKNEATAANNGIYTVTSLGSGSTKWVLTRATDVDDASEFGGAFVFVENGTVNATTGWVMNTAPPITVGTTAINWTQFSQAGVILPGNGLTKSGNTISVLPGNGIIADGSSTRVDPAVVVRRYQTDVGDGSSTAIVLTHGLATQDVHVTLYDKSSPYEEVYADVEHTSTNTVTLRFSVAPTSNQYRCVVFG